MKLRCRHLLLLALLPLAPSCTESARRPATLTLQRVGASAGENLGGHLPPTHEVTVRTSSGEHVVSRGAYFAALGPEDRVAFVDERGLHLWENGRSRRLADATPRGLGAAPIGVAFTSAAEQGEGSGVSFMSWKGELRQLLPAPEGLPGPAGYHTPAVSPDGRFVVAFSDVTPRPSLHRVELSTGAATQISEDVPGIVGLPAWSGDVLIWSTGDARAALHVPTGELSSGNGGTR